MDDVAERTYKFGYPVNGVYRRLTLAEMGTKWTWTHLHPEMRRRIIGMMNAAQDAGHDPGVGEGARSMETQRTTFLARHYVVASGGCCSYQGKRYQLRKGYAHAAPPGSSVHEDQLYDGFALAVDMTGWEDHWFDRNCQDFGLKNFGGAVGPNVNGEEWHHQPIEFGNSRSTIVAQIKAGARLQTWPLEHDTPTPPYQPPPPIEVPKGSYTVLATGDQIVAVEAPRWDARPFGFLVGQHGIGFEGGAGKKMVACHITLESYLGNTEQGYATAWSGLYPAPNHSFTNYNPGEWETGFVLVPLAPDGTFMIYLSQPAKVFADIQAYVI